MLSRLSGSKAVEQRPPLPSLEDLRSYLSWKKDRAVSTDRETPSLKTWEAMCHAGQRYGLFEAMWERLPAWAMHALFSSEVTELQAILARQDKR